MGASAGFPMKQTRPPIVCPNEAGTRYQVVESFDFYGHTVPAGFEFDAASVPRVFWRLVPPCMPWLLRASCGHDYLYANGLGTKKAADAHFFNALLEDGVGNVMAYAMYLAVKGGGKGNFKT